MIVLSLHDTTQETICVKLAYTEYMLREVLKKYCGISSWGEITTLEDLGFANNHMRMRGGFYTGINVKWQSDIPFIPVDTTVNSCGVSIFRFDGNVDFDAFQNKMQNLEELLAQEGISNNYNRGNHFISICSDDCGQKYLVLHASDNKYKYGDKGLYPREDTWYYNQIQTEMFPNGYLRYIIGDVAEKFHRLYTESEKSNPIRNKIVAEIVLADYANIEEVLYSAHYGMPNNSSISIGSQWQKQNYVLLSSEGSPIYIIEESNPHCPYMPHGFGLTIKGKCNSLSFSDEDIVINGISICCKNGFIASGITQTRNTGVNVTNKVLNDFLPSRSITIVKKLKQMYSYTRNGIKKFE